MRFKFREAAIGWAALGLGLWSAGTAAAQATAPANYSGDLWTRPALTGDWGGVRNDLAREGITFDMSVTQVFAGVVSGGRSTGSEYGGRGDLIINLDTQKAGLWPGGFFTVEAEGNWGNNINRKTGALLPVDSSNIYPLPGDSNFDVPEVSYTQFVSPHLGFFLGKIATITSTEGDMNAFAHGKGDDNFLNMAFNFNPVATLMPYSALGAGAVILPGKKPEDAVISLAVLDAEGNPNTTGFNTMFKGGTIYAGEARVKTDFFGMTGHQLIGGIYSDKLYRSLDQTLRFVVEDRALKTTSGAWSIYYNFDQYFYEPEKGSGRGIGVFGRFGATEDKVLPAQFFSSVGIGGNGLIPTRRDDSFGVGYYYLSTGSANLVSRLRLNDEWGVEAFYNIALTPWAHLTADVQYIDGAGARSGDAVILGARLKIRL